MHSYVIAPTRLPQFTQTLPRHLVHRAAVAETLLTDWFATGEDTFLLGAHWPRAHSFYEPIAGLFDPLLIAETLRQSALAIAHLAYEVPLEHRFISRSLSYKLLTPEHLVIGATPADLEVFARCQDVRLRRGGLVSMTVCASVRQGHITVAEATGDLQVMSRAVYDRIRGEHSNPVPPPPSAPLPPEAVGRDRPRDVVLSATTHPDTWQVRVDPTHPVLFDHPLDHVPGMLLMEALRQAGCVLAGSEVSLPTSLAMVYHQFVEYEEPCLLSAVLLEQMPDGSLSVRARLFQSGREVADGLITLLPLKQL